MGMNVTKEEWETQLAKEFAHLYESPMRCGLHQDPGKAKEIETQNFQLQDQIIHLGTPVIGVAFPPCREWLNATGYSNGNDLRWCANCLSSALQRDDLMSRHRSSAGVNGMHNVSPEV